VILLLYTIPPPWVKRYLKVFDAVDLKAVMSPAHLGETIRHAYPPEMAVEMACAVIDYNKPSFKQFIADEGIPMLAAIGSSDVAKAARGGKSQLADAVGQLGSGAAGLQGLAALVAKPGKGSGLGDLIQYLPVIQQFMGSQSQSPDPSNGGPQQAPTAGQHVGGKIGGNLNG
ncbi:unnamed protein product, partial [marine sediment metagenome]